MLEEVTSRLGVDFYLREETLASSEATSDQVVLDFFDNHSCDRVFWLNTVRPLQTITDIQNFVIKSNDASWESSVSFNPALVHVVYDNKPLNFKWDSGLQGHKT